MGTLWSRGRSATTSAQLWSAPLPPGDHQIAAIAARSLDRAQEFSKKHRIQKAYGSYEELADDPEIDVVYLGVLHTEHWRVGLLFLNAGKNVPCEKPFAVNSRQVKDLIAASRKSNVQYS